MRGIVTSSGRHVCFECASVGGRETEEDCDAMVIRTRAIVAEWLESDEGRAFLEGP